MLAHLVSFDEEETIRAQYGAKKKTMLARYKEIRKELKKYDNKLDLGEDGLSSKEEIIILTKSDVIADQKAITKKIKEFQKITKNVFVLSLYDDKMVKKLRDELIKILKKPRP